MRQTATAQEKPMEGEKWSPSVRGSQRAKADRHPRSEGRQSHSAVRQWSGTEAKIDGEEFLIMKESDTMGIVEGRAANQKKAA
jgi:chaperonin GroES